MIADFEPHSKAVFFKVLVKPLVNLIWLAGLRVRVRLAGRAVAGRPRTAASRDATRARAGVNTLAVVLGAAIAVAAVLLVALPFLREPQTDDDRLDAPTEAEGQRLTADRRARPCARRAEGARVRPPHRQIGRCRLPAARRSVPPGRRYGLARDRAVRVRRSGPAERSSARRSPRRRLTRRPSSRAG